MSHLHPLSFDTLLKDDVVPGVRFTWFIPGDPSSVKTGEFLSYPDLDGHEEIIVQYHLDGDDTIRTTDLCSMGITPNSSGNRTNSITVAGEVT